MNITEQFIFNQHMKNIDITFENFAHECMEFQSVNGISMIYATDIHYIRKYALLTPSYYKLEEMVNFSGHIGADLLAITGDMVDGNTTVKRQYRDIFDCISLLKKSKTTSVLLSKGNHDTCEWYAYKEKLGVGNWITKRDWYIHAVNPLKVQYPMTLDCENIDGGYYYIDFPTQKIRVININTSDTVNVLNKHGLLVKEYCSQWRFAIQEKQLKWLVDSLKFDEEGWSVIFMSHNFLCPIDTVYGHVTNGDLAWNIICAFKNKEKGTVISNKEYYNAEVSYDFTENKTNDVLTYIFGHMHRDDNFVYDGITAISTQKVLNCDKEWDDENAQITGGWDFINIDKENRIFKSKRYGVPSAEREIKL